MHLGIYRDRFDTFKSELVPTKLEDPRLKLGTCVGKNFPVAIDHVIFVKTRVHDGMCSGVDFDDLNATLIIVVAIESKNAGLI